MPFRDAWTPEKYLKRVIRCSVRAGEKPPLLPEESLEIGPGDGTLLVCDAHVSGRSDYLGYLYRDGARALPRDVADMCAMLKKRYPGKKLCLIGHSMGSLVSLSCLKQYSEAFDALLLSGCPAPNPAAGPGMALGV